MMEDTLSLSMIAKELRRFEKTFSMFLERNLAYVWIEC